MRHLEVQQGRGTESRRKEPREAATPRIRAESVHGASCFACRERSLAHPTKALFRRRAFVAHRLLSAEAIGTAIRPVKLNLLNGFDRSVGPAELGCGVQAGKIPVTRSWLAHLR